MMEKIGLVAGAGDLPLEYARAAKEAGKKLVVLAAKGMASTELEEVAHKVYWIDFGQYAKAVFFLIKERVKKIVLLGKVRKDVLYDDVLDKKAGELYKGMKDAKDYTILKSITNNLSKVGIEVVSPADLLQHLIPPQGLHGKHVPDTATEEDMDFGFSMAKDLAGMDIGQTVIVKDKMAVAVEAIEGTDNLIVRANKLAGVGCVMVKASRPEQDMRWDIPTIGLQTIKLLVDNGYKAIAIESDKMFLLQKEEVLKLADEHGLVVKVM